MQSVFMSDSSRKALSRSSIEVESWTGVRGSPSPPQSSALPADLSLLCTDTDTALSNYRICAILLHRIIKPALQEYCGSCKNKGLVNGIGKASHER